MATSRAFTMKVSGDAVVEVKLAGWITENANLDLTKIPEGRAVVLDVGDVRVINSLGCRDWMQFVTKLCNRSPNVTIKRLSPMLAFHASTIRNFLAWAKVESVLTPWRCTQCEHDVEQLQAPHSDVKTGLPCPKCGGVMELDTFEGVYEEPAG